ncbi:hypothetical protein [Saccharibacter floricola]|uniref:Uncharacterized protein n=1 Tax=Saccharibacter floricola DSM 15669 TaxID=1123227 RepID=A0ABQ0P078_9PROT|nr:hypothetical protein [Saccharibacter floricola]GBQ07933.1 hypothetical protein AA15669_1596 [Saccharibacter floricola DSM 15669]
MPDADCARRGEVNELRDRVVTLETKQKYAQESIQSLSDKVSAVASQMNDGFAKISQQMSEMNNRKTMLLTVAGGAGGGIAVGLFDLCKKLFGG